MKKIFEKIWDLALPYQDKHNDNGHAQIVTNFAIELCDIEKANEDIAIPAAIMHDIGWSQLSKEERFLIFNPDRTPEIEYAVRIKHQEEGVKLTKKILEFVNYPSKESRQILEIISGHDTRKGFISKEDGVTRDADKLWRFSKTGFIADLSRNQFTFKHLYEKLNRQIDINNFYYSEATKKIARKELDKRKEEYEK